MLKLDNRLVGLVLLVGASLLSADPIAPQLLDLLNDDPSLLLDPETKIAEPTPNSPEEPVKREVSSEEEKKEVAASPAVEEKKEEAGVTAPAVEEKKEVAASPAVEEKKEEAGVAVPAVEEKKEVAASPAVEEKKEEAGVTAPAVEEKKEVAASPAVEEKKEEAGVTAPAVEEKKEVAASPLVGEAKEDRAKAEASENSEEAPGSNSQIEVSFPLAASPVIVVPSEPAVAPPQVQKLRSELEAVPGVGDYAIILDGNQFYPASIRMKNGSKGRLLFITTGQKPAALVFVRPQIQRWISSSASNKTEKSVEEFREFSAEKVAQIPFEAEVGVYEFYDALSGAKGEIRVE